MKKNDSPDLYCSKGDILTLIKQIQVSDNEKAIVLEIGTAFRVENIIGYGFDLVRIDGNPIEIRILNSEMPEFFGDKNS